MIEQDVAERRTRLVMFPPARMTVSPARHPDGSRCKGSGAVWTGYWTCAPVGNLQVQGSARTYPKRVKGNLRFDPTVTDA
jgi:hypothetical protein